MKPVNEDWTGVAIGLLHHLQKARQDSTYRIPRLACLLLLQHGEEERVPSPPVRRRHGDQGASASPGEAVLLCRMQGWGEASVALRRMIEGDPSQARCVEQFLTQALRVDDKSLASAASLAPPGGHVSTAPSTFWRRTRSRYAAAGHG
jgi:hypothetical protein